jgi:spermidine synthase
MIRFAALLLTVLTGFSGLVYEVAWQKYLATLLGSHAEATATVLAIFLGGLSAGYALFGWVTRRAVLRARQSSRPPNLLSIYGLVEIAIGAYALLFPFLFGLAQALSLLFPHASQGVGFAFDVFLTTLLIGPPTVLMGGTIPILTLALAGSLERATRVHAWIYGCNTAGAFAGALAGGFFLVPLLGLDGVLYAMGFVNLVAGAVFVRLGRRGQSVAPDLAAPAAAAAPGARFAAYAGVALLAGFAMMTLQTTLNRIGGLAFGASHFTFAMVVAVFVLCIALGSLAVSALPRIPPGLIVGSQWTLVASLFLLYFQMPNATYWAHWIRTVFSSTDAAFYPYHFFAFLAALAVLALPIGLSGALLPLLFHQLRREVGDLGSVAGRLYSWNTVGSLLGALLGGYLLLLWLDLHQVYRIAVAVLAVAAAILTLLLLRTAPKAIGALALLPTLGALWLLPAWEPHRLAAGLFRQRKALPLTPRGPDALFARRRLGEVLFYEDDPTSSVTVSGARRGNGQKSRSIIVNGKSDGNLIGDYPTMALSALIPALMAEKHERCFVIGWGMGVTAGELGALQGTREVTVAEISRGVLHAAPLFDEGNLGASKNPKIVARRGDAYRTLLQSDQRYDLIVSEPSNPWVTGVEMLYSREFLEAARSRLAPGGVYGQWFHLYELDVESVALVLRTFDAVFPQVSVWYTLVSDILLLGFDQPDRALDVRGLEERFHRPDFAAGFARVGIESFPALLAHELLPLGTVRAMGLEGPLHTLRNPILSHYAARAFFRGGIARLPRYVRPPHTELGAQNSLLRRYAAQPDGRLPESVLEEAARETCRHNRWHECATLFARWQHDHPGSSRLEQELAQSRSAAPALLDPSHLELLGSLFDRDGAAAGGVPPAEALQATELFLRHYHHAAPFDRGALESIWSRCEGSNCGARRRQAESEVGLLGGVARGAAGRPGEGPATARRPR